MTCPWSPSRSTELSPCQTSAAWLSSAPRRLISTSSLLLLALPWRPPSDFAQTDIPAWPVCSRPEPLEVGDIWDHTGERKKLFAGSPEPLWEMGLVRNRQPGEPLLTPDREKWEGWHQVTDSWQISWACRVLKLLHRTLRCQGMLPYSDHYCSPLLLHPKQQGLQKLSLKDKSLLSPLLVPQPRPIAILNLHA